MWLLYSNKSSLPHYALTQALLASYHQAKPSVVAELVLDGDLCD